MFPFKKKPTLVEAQTPAEEKRERLNKRLDDTHTRLETVLREMDRRIEERKRRPRLVTQ